MLCLFIFVLLLQYIFGIDVITTIAGNGASSFSGDGDIGTNAALFQPFGIALDLSGTQSCEYCRHLSNISLYRPRKCIHC